MTDEGYRALATVSDLATSLEAAGAAPVVIDVRWAVGAPSQRPAYLQAHIPGARWCDLDADLADPPGDPSRPDTGGRHPLPNPHRLQRRLRDWGVDDSSEVVVYDAADSVAAARAWWVLRWAGLRRVRVLDGGFAAWISADRPVESEERAPSPGTVTVASPGLPTLDATRSAEWAAAGRLIDVRAPERFRGEIEPMDPVAGRIPGAINVPTTGNTISSGHFLPAERIRRRLTEAGVSAGGAPLGVYCGSGVTAAHTVLALHLAGVPAVLYPGSWSEWITDPARPVATG